MPDPQNVYILQDFDLGSEVEAALKKAEVSVSETQVDTKLSTKQDVLTPAQQAAVDSGVTAAKMTEITNTITEVQTIVIEQIPVGKDLLYATNVAVTLDSTDYTVTFQLKDQKGNNLGTEQTIDLPVESLVMNVEYDSVNDCIVITLQNGTKTYIPVSSLVSGLQPAITPSNKLSADLVDDNESNNKFMTTAQANKLANAVNKVKTQDLENISGLVIENGTDDDKIISHSNVITAEPTAVFGKVAYDRHGHITSTTPVTATDITGLVDGADIKLTGYEIADHGADVLASDTVNQAIGKLEKTIKESSSAVSSVSETTGSHLSVSPTTGAVKVGVESGHTIPADTDIADWNSKLAGNVTINSKSVADSPTLDGTDIELTGYEKPQATSAVEATDTVNEAIGKLEKAQENVGRTYSNSSAGWAAQPTLVSELNAIYVYTDFESVDDKHIPAMKIGDGVTRVVELPFSSANGITTTKIAEWDSKVSAALSASGDTLLLY